MPKQRPKCRSILTGSTCSSHFTTRLFILELNLWKKIVKIMKKNSCPCLVIASINMISYIPHLPKGRQRPWYIKWFPLLLKRLSSTDFSLCLCPRPLACVYTGSVSECSIFVPLMYCLLFHQFHTVSMTVAL